VRPLFFRARDKEIRLDRGTALMGVVNVTPDSFYPASRAEEPESAVARALELVAAGADIVDLGGESTRPGARTTPVEEEVRRVIPVVQRLRPLTAALISVDTRKADVAERALEAGADMINDVSALAGDERMADVVARAGAGLVVMHMRGTPATMQKHPEYHDVVDEVRDFLERAVDRAESAGVAPDSIFVDPGIGFGKTAQHNLVLLNRLESFFPLGKPILVGTSRKSFLGRLLDLHSAPARDGHSAPAEESHSAPAEERLLGTAASVACAVLRGADAVRVHDVAEMRDVVRVAAAIRSEGRDGGAR
jgi:dihydropteroate synthase